MKGYVDNIESLTERNTGFRHVLYTGGHLQLVLMSLKPGEDIGTETHANHDQFFRIETGSGNVVIDDVRHAVEAGQGIVVPAGARHNLTNTGTEAMKLYTIYGPPHHLDQIDIRSKAEALATPEQFSGLTTE